LSSSPTLDRIVQAHGDLLFDLCESVLWSPINAQLAFRAIIKDIKKGIKTRHHQQHERAWVLRVACDRLLAFADRHGRRVTASEQLELDSQASVAQRLKQLDHYFHRLTSEEQLLLLLRDKHSLDYPEIASAMSIPEGSLKMRRQQALRTLEEWVWA
jgi:DNA-directed RNA polymerase specialized sigma24 family protein